LVNSAGILSEYSAIETSTLHVSKQPKKAKRFCKYLYQWPKQEKGLLPENFGAESCLSPGQIAMQSSSYRVEGESRTMRVSLQEI
jgi:hypothetical protein